MLLNDLKPAWKRLKVINSLQPIDSNDILAIIELPQQANKNKLQGLAINVAMFIIIAICCQGG
ncbi:hypothetical protein BFP71_15620 [Roseivirga misakiensis]|uniref:Uncharacterized protein n=1 Tax=Roseivirga misakiensis TaxID=1563681 RepID=A0A1E5T0I4_9BACT|nr:hypothetical protein BFP71_15620 [Roseivirga misakiensis]